MSAAPIAHAAKLPALQVNPQVTDGSITYYRLLLSPVVFQCRSFGQRYQSRRSGDCYFLSTLSAIAKVDPAAIRKDIINNNDGTYTVNFVKGGTKTPIRVSATLPTWPDGQLAYAGLGADNSTWVAVMEKAFAEFRTHAKTYASLSGGWMSEVFSDLGIKSQSTFSAANVKAFDKIIVNDLKAKQPRRSRPATSSAMARR